MMKDAYDPHDIVFFIVEYAMLPMMETAKRWLDIVSQLPRVGMPSQQSEGLLEAADIIFADRDPEPRNTEIENVDEIGVRCGAEPKFSHAGRR